MNVPISSGRLVTLCCAAVALAWAMAAPPARADSTNMLELRPGTAVALPTAGYVDLTKEGAVEFWYRHQVDQAPLKAFTEAKFTDEAYSVVLTGGTGARMAFAVIIGPGTRDGQASIGVVNDLSVLADNAKVKQAVVRVSRADDLGKRDPVEFVKGSTYHILLAKRPGRDEVRVFVNGALQGSVPGTFGKAAGAPIVLGWDPKSAAPATRPADAEPAPEPPVYPFDGFVGGLRVWRTGEMEESDVLRLAEFGRLTEPADLTTLPMYGDLAAWGDFIGRRWNPQRQAYVDTGEPRLRVADPLAGAWFADGAAVRQTKADASVFDDFPLYTFVPATPVPLPPAVADRRYNVFEDANFIGTLVPDPAAAAADGREAWRFTHAAWKRRDGVTVEHLVAGDRRVLAWSLGRDAREGPIAGATTGDVRMKRRTVVDMGVKSPTVSKATPEEAKRQAQADSMTLVFLYTAYPKFYDLAYRSYNIARMDPWNLFERGVGTDQTVLRVPEANQMFKLSTSEQMIMPYDLEVMQAQLALDNQTSTFVSSAAEYNAAVTNRLGAGISGSATVGTGGMLPVSASATINLAVVVQGETVKEMSGTSSASVEKILRNKWEKKHTLVHRREVMRLSDAYAEALRALHAQASPASVPPDVRRQLVFAFFDKWGTHYPLAVVFGNLEFTETTVNDRMRSAAGSESSSFEVSINEGKSGITKVKRDGQTEQLRDGTTVVRSFGDAQNAAPIALDLRPLHDLLTPQHFPDEPHMYTEMRYLLGSLLADYRDDSVATVVKGLKGSAAAAATKVVSDLKAPPAAMPKVDLLAVRYKGVSMDVTPFAGADGLTGSLKVNGEITVSAEATAMPFRYDIPAGMREQADAFGRANRTVYVVRSAEKEEQARFIKVGPNAGVQAFGTPLQSDVIFRVPFGGLRDYLYVTVGGGFTVDGGAGGMKFRGDSILGLDMVRHEMARALFPVIPNGARVDPYDTAAPDAATIPGSLIWVTGNPITLNYFEDPPFKPVRNIALPKTQLRVAKDRTDARRQQYVFQYPDANNGWRSAAATVRTTEVKNKLVPGPNVYVHYEYALLKDLKDAMASNKNLRPDNVWGRFSPGAKTPDVNPLANRSTRVLNLPPAAPLPWALLDQLKVGPDAKLTNHQILAAPGVPMASRGFGQVGFVPGMESAAWTFVPRGPGEWMVLSPIDARALAVRPNGLATVPAKDGDDEQVWLATPVDAAAGTYQLKNKKTGLLLGRVAAPAAGGPVLIPPGGPAVVVTTFTVSPKLEAKAP